MAIFRSLSKENFKKILNSYFPEIIIFLLLFCSYLYPRIRNPYIFSYDGLFMEMSERILQNHFALPLSLPYYGPGGIPFAYPPLGFYVCAFTIKAFNISIFQYARFAPIIFFTGAMIALYFLVQSITESRAKGIFTAILYGTSTIGYSIHAQESGMVRGLALFFSLVGLVAFYGVFNNNKRVWPILIGTLCLACTALTHFSYLIFFIISILVLFIFGKERFSRRLITALLMCAIAALLTMPWFITIFTRHGITPFLNSSSTHGGLTAIQFNSFRSLALSLRNGLGNIYSQWTGTATGAIGLVLLGLCYVLFKKKWFLLVWFLAIFLFVAENARYLYIVGAALAAEVVIDLFYYMEPGHFKARSSQAIMRFFPILLILSVFWMGFIYSLKDTVSLDIPDITNLARWFQNNTSENASYLFIANSVNYAENMPFFIDRTPVIAPWGSEWTSSYNNQKSMYSSLLNCVQQNSIACVYSLLQQKNLSPDYLITFNDNSVLTQDIGESSAWQKIYNNPKFLVYKRE
jgi:hypothetical protein